MKVFQLSEVSEVHTSISCVQLINDIELTSSAEDDQFNYMPTTSMGDIESEGDRTAHVLMPTEDHE